MVDDAGTLINMETRDTYDYMEDIVDTLPKCELNVKPIHSETNACEDFEMIGRGSR